MQLGGLGDLDPQLAEAHDALLVKARVVVQGALPGEEGPIEVFRVPRVLKAVVPADRHHVDVVQGELVEIRPSPERFHAQIVVVAGFKIVSKSVH